MPKKCVKPARGVRSLPQVGSCDGGHKDSQSPWWRTDQAGAAASSLAHAAVFLPEWLRRRSCRKRRRYWSTTAPCLTRYSVLLPSPRHGRQRRRSVAGAGSTATSNAARHNLLLPGHRHGWWRRHSFAAARCRSSASRIAHHTLRSADWQRRRPHRVADRRTWRGWYAFHVR